MMLEDIDIAQTYHGEPGDVRLPCAHPPTVRSSIDPIHSTEEGLAPLIALTAVVVGGSVAVVRSAAPLATPAEG